MKLYVSSNNECLVRKRGKGQFANWSANYDFAVQGVSLSKETYFSAVEIEVPFEVKDGEAVYVLSYTYSSGDSFGTARGQGSVVHVFKDPSIAFAAAAEYEKRQDDYKILLTIDGGEVKSFDNGCYGYFENLTSVDVTRFVVESNPSDEENCYE